MFEAKRKDGKSYRVLVLEVFQDKKPEQVVTYNELAAHCDLHPINDRAQIQQSVNAANKALLKLHQRGVQAVRRVGYRVLPARENMLAANGHQTKADRQMRKAIQFFSGTKLEDLTEKELRIHQGQAMLAQTIYASHQHLARRIKRLEDIVG